MTRKGRVAVVAGSIAVAIVGLGGCAGDPSSEPKGTTSEVPSSVGTGAGSTEDLLLAQQVQLWEAGEGYLSCVDDFEVLPELYRTGPAVWISSGRGDPLRFWSTDLPYVTLCLNGYSAVEPIVITLVADDFRAQTTAVPKPEPSVAYGSQSPYTLFEHGTTLEVTPTNADLFPGSPPLLSSSHWRFLPPTEALAAIGRSGALTVTAEQGSVTASTEQSFTAPDQPGQAIAQPLPVGEARLLVWGYPAGAEVPIGLYKEEDVTLSLVEQIGTVIMSDYRISEFELPQERLHSVPPGTYCVLPPLDEGSPTNCERVWPPFPGEVHPGDNGEAARRWEWILTSAKVFEAQEAGDGKGEASDGVYGPAEEEAVRAREAWEGLPVDGVLDVDFYATLTGALQQE